MAIQRVKCRAEVSVGGITIRTPFVQSFNVRKQRGQVSTFTASLKVPAGTSSQLAGGDVIIKAGEEGSLNTIFTGICRQANVSPCFDDPQYVLVSISGVDKLSLLQGKKFTRRCRATDTAWCAITGVSRKGLKSGKFAYNTEPILDIKSGKIERQNNLAGFRAENIKDAIKPASTSNSGKEMVPKIFATIKAPIVGGDDTA